MNNDIRAAGIYVVAVLIFLTCLLASRIVTAQSLLYEIEPNDAPSTANPVSGPAIIAGTLASNDQDGFRWTVSDVDAQKRWTLSLDGIPGQLTVVDVYRLQYAENGIDITDKQKLFTIGSRDGSKPAVANDLIFEPGEYILGIAGSGPATGFRPPVDSASFDEQSAMLPGETADETTSGGYRLRVQQGSRLILYDADGNNTTQESARSLRLEQEHAAYSEAENLWFNLEISEKLAEQQWQIAMQLPVGQHYTSTLTDASGKQLAQRTSDEFGKLNFNDLGLSKGTYYLKLNASTEGSVKAISVMSTGITVAGQEAEPNDNWQTANRVDFQQPLAGRLAGSGDDDFYRFSISATASDEMLSLKLMTSPIQRTEFCLLDASGNRLQCRVAEGQLELADLGLAPGDYGLSVGRYGEDLEYSVSMTPSGRIPANRELEPNDSLQTASSVPSNNRIKGRFSDSTRDRDFFKFIITDQEPQLWRFQVIGDDLLSLEYFDRSGRKIQEFRAENGQRRIRLDNLFLLPGEHFVAVTGKGDGQYTLLARPLGAPDPNAEREPNDDQTRIQPLHIGQRRSGLLADKNDIDNYRFNLAGYDHVRLSIEPPTDGAIHAYLYWDDKEIKATQEPNSASILEGVLPPGDYRLRLVATQPSEAEYHVALERLPRFGCPKDCEPNDQPANAAELPGDHLLEGRAGDWRDDDWFVLPEVEVDTTLTIRNLHENWPTISAFSGNLDENLLQNTDDPALRRATLAAGKRSYLRIDDWGMPNYRLQLAFDPGPSAGQHGSNPSLQLQLQTEYKQVAAYEPYGQQVTAGLHITNSGEQTEKLRIRSTTSDWRWQARTDHSATVPPGETRSLPVYITVPDDAWAGHPVRISIGVTNQHGLESGTAIDIDVNSMATAVSAQPYWPLPEALRGGFNVAWQALGGRWTDQHGSDIGTGFEFLFDGLAIKDNGLNLRGRQHDDVPVVTVELAGDGPVEVAGVAINLLSDNTLPRLLAEVDLSLSTDGKIFTPVLRAPLDPVKQEQAFVLEQPVTARYAQLRLNGDFHDGTQFGLGEWKVIASPGYDVSAGKGFNLLDPALGGHVVWSSPLLSQKWDRTILTEAEDTDSIRINPGNALEWVVGFHHNRAARIERLQWRNMATAGSDQLVRKVRVWTSIDSPLGPWRLLGEWKFDSDVSHDWDLDSPVWARFVRFATDNVETQRQLAPPETLRIYESPGAEDYRSVLTEWGHNRTRAFYESQQALPTNEIFTSSGNNRREDALLLGTDADASGHVLLGVEDDWFVIDVANTDNTLNLTLNGDPTIRTQLLLEDNQGDTVTLRPKKRNPNQQTYEATVRPGSRYYLKVSESPRNALFVWDTSASVNPYLPIIYQALIAYAADVVPDRDSVNLLPFGSDMLLQSWHSQPYVLQTTLNDYPRRESSSEAEKTLFDAAKALADRNGSKAVILITDAATGRYPAMWDAFHDASPRIFALGLSSEGALGGEPALYQDLLQDWSSVNGGHYQYVSTFGDMEVAFDRAAALLRRPAGYRLQLLSSFREDPGPGSLVVVGKPTQDTVASGAVELILDASGSMLKRLEGKRRINIAKDVLLHAVNDVIPAGTPVALRVFGHRQSNACRTDLEVKLQPLDPAKISNKIQQINARNLARTPIAESLAKVENDLNGVKGRRVVILVTDGEETCDGNPAEVLQTLAARGIDIRLNIVGFAIDDKALKTEFENWARQGGGRYFDAADSDALMSSVTAALRTPYQVYDRNGDLVAEGFVNGAPLQLEAGVYRVVADGKPVGNGEDVLVEGGEEVKLDY